MKVTAVIGQAKIAVCHHRNRHGKHTYQDQNRQQPPPCAGDFNHEDNPGTTHRPLFNHIGKVSPDALF
jgi:hypothetical protein